MNGVIMKITGNIMIVHTYIDNIVCEVMNTYGNPNNTSKKKRHEKDVVVTKAHGVRNKGIVIRAKTNGTSKGVSSLVNPKDIQVNTSKVFILCYINVIIDNN